MVAGHIDHSSAAFGMAHDTTDYISMALFPTPLVLLNFPGIDYIAYKVKCFASIIFKEVI
jgi:hypothetical protein